MKKSISSLFYLFLPLLLGGLAAFLIKDSIDYTSLLRPPLAPPKILFPIAWTIIYLLMGISYYLYKKEYEENDIVDVVYYLQLIINALWSILFFLWNARFIAILWIVLLDVLVLFLLYFFLYRKKNKCNPKYPLFTMDPFCYLFNHWYLCIKLTSLGSFFTLVKPLLH